MIKRAAGLLGVHQIHVDRARFFKGLEDRFARYLMERDPMRSEVRGLVAASLTQGGQHVPGNGLTLPVGVRRKEQSSSGTKVRCNASDVLAAVPRRLVMHAEVIVRLNGSVLCNEIPDVPVAGMHFVVRTQIPTDGTRLGGRFHDYDVGGFGHGLFELNRPRTRTRFGSRRAGG